MLLSTAVGSCDGGSFDAPVPETVAAFVPLGEPVHSQHAATFDFDGRQVRLTHVEYGARMDCSSGCFSSHVCAIEDGSDVLLFYAFWTTPGEAPVGLSTSCPGLDSGRTSETFPTCEPDGKVHPVVMTDAFASFAERQFGSGPFRWCVNEFVSFGCLTSPCP